MYCPTAPEQSSLARRVRPISFHHTITDPSLPEIASDCYAMKPRLISPKAVFGTRQGHEDGKFADHTQRAVRLDPTELTPAIQSSSLRIRRARLPRHVAATSTLRELDPPGGALRLGFG